MPRNVVYPDPMSAQRYRDEVGGVVEEVPGGFMVGEVDELGYMGGGMAHEKRDPIKYAKGGAVKGKGFKGNY
jgi:hypothetical protein